MYVYLDASLEVKNYRYRNENHMLAICLSRVKPRYVSLEDVLIISLGELTFFLCLWYKFNFFCLVGQLFMIYFFCLVGQLFMEKKLNNDITIHTISTATICRLNSQPKFLPKIMIPFIFLIGKLHSKSVLMIKE